MKLGNLLNEIKITNKKEVFLKVWNTLNNEGDGGWFECVTNNTNAEEAIKDYKDRTGDDVDKDFEDAMRLWFTFFKPGEVWYIEQDAENFDGESELPNSYKHITYGSSGKRGPVWVLLSNENYLS